MRIGIIGAGISGLSAGTLLDKTYDVEILEKEELIGGIARCRMVGEIPYHTVGGHCLNSNNPEMMEFIFEKVLPQTSWHKVQRIAKISFSNHLVDYPIEFSIPQIAMFDKDLAFRMASDFFSSEERPVTTLDDWFRMKFGNTLAEEYFLPYNKKIWCREPSEISPNWVKGKLPIPDKKQFFRSLIEPKKDSMPHSTFYYPNNNTQNQFIAALACDLNIDTNYGVFEIEKKGKQWIVNGEKTYDTIISTVPLNLLPFVIQGVPEKVKQAARLLLYNKVTNMLWETEQIEATWTYFPDLTTIFHRHIHIGNFLSPKTNHTITESMCVKSFEQMEKEGKKISYLKKAIDYNVSDHAYVVFDHNHIKSVTMIKDFLTSIGIYTVGRFGEWEYYNMDACIESVMRLVAKINNGSKNIGTSAA